MSASFSLIGFHPFVHTSVDLWWSAVTAAVTRVRGIVLWSVKCQFCFKKDSSIKVKMWLYTVIRAVHFTFLVFTACLWISPTPLYLSIEGLRRQYLCSFLLSQLRQTLAVIHGYMRKDCIETFKNQDSLWSSWVTTHQKWNFTRTCSNLRKAFIWYCFILSGAQPFPWKRYRSSR